MNVRNRTLTLVLSATLTTVK
ncbi:elongation factor Tu GTP binding domain protein, partial [Vibrio parahaemolyticus VPTS-2010]